MLDLPAVLAASAAYGIPEPHPGARALAPDSCRLLGALVRALRPRSVLEFGSGYSSVVIARELERLGAGSLDSIDHSPTWSARTREMAERHGVRHRVRLHVFPLGVRLHDGVPSVFYRIPRGFYGHGAGYDLVFVDGPGHEVGRDGALPEALPRLGVPGWVILDDCRSDHVRRSLARWTARFGTTLAVREYLEVGNGIAVIEKLAEPTTAGRLPAGPWVAAWLRVVRNLARLSWLGLNRDRVPPGATGAPLLITGASGNAGTWRGRAVAR